MAAPDNKQLAGIARGIADQHPGGSLQRRAAACANVALSTTRTLIAARRVLAELDEDVRGAALAVVEQLENEAP